MSNLLKGCKLSYGEVIGNEMNAYLDKQDTVFSLCRTI